MYYKRLILLMLCVFTLPLSAHKENRDDDALSRADIVFSKLDPLKKKIRERAFTPWMKKIDAEEYYRKEKKKGKRPLYIEMRGRNEVRMILIDKPKGSRRRSTWKIHDLNDLKQKMKESWEEGYHLVSAFEYKAQNEEESDLYTAVWFSESGLKEVSRKLKKFGISRAEYKSSQ